ncbi:MAG: hypothetical protein HRU34_04360 [Richelia sp.]|nr:hypothetical protein [Richelia sp.]CDN10238.1 hypothetical protein RintRC_4323 [Richelia intracellularis]
MNHKNQLENHLTHIARQREPYLASAGHFFLHEYIPQELSQWGSVEIHTIVVGGKPCKRMF